MTLEDATAAAQTQATAAQHPIEIWEHVGGRQPWRPYQPILPQQRFITRDPETEAEPRYVWRLKTTVAPEAQP